MNNLDKQLEKFTKKILNFSQEEIGLFNKKKRDDLTKLRLLSVIKFLGYTQLIKENSHTFQLLGSLFVLESLVAAKRNNKLKRVKKLFRDDLVLEDKISLLGGFIFSNKYEFRKLDQKEERKMRHVMFNDFNQDINFEKGVYINKENYCSSSEHPICRCVDWLKENNAKVNEYIDTLIDYLYEMRHAIVHEAFPVFCLPDYSEKNTAGSFSASIIDCYPVSSNKKYFRSYEVGIDPEDFFRIIKNCIRKHLLG